MHFVYEQRKLYTLILFLPPIISLLTIGFVTTEHIVGTVVSYSTSLTTNWFHEYLVFTISFYQLNRLMYMYLVSYTNPK